jgi:hypothetical protein
LHLGREEEENNIEPFEFGYQNISLSNILYSKINKHGFVLQIEPSIFRHHLVLEGQKLNTIPRREEPIFETKINLFLANDNKLIHSKENNGDHFIEISHQIGYEPNITFHINLLNRERNLAKLIAQESHLYVCEL